MDHVTEYPEGIVEDHAQHIWDPEYLDSTSVSNEAIADAEARLRIKIPQLLIDQFRVQNGGYLYVEGDDGSILFQDGSNERLWTNAAASGLLAVEDWTAGTDSGWFSEAVNLPDVDKLIVIAQIAESHLCLDYRACGATGMPVIAYVDFTSDPLVITEIATVQGFVGGILTLKGKSKRYPTLTRGDVVPCYNCGTLLRPEDKKCRACGEVFVYD